MTNKTGRRQRRRYSQAFKLEAVRLAQEGDRSLAQLERDLGLSSALLGRWVREYEEEGEAAFLQQRSASDKARIRELERQLADAKEERDILKKAVAIFSQPKDSGSSS